MPKQHEEVVYIGRRFNINPGKKEESETVHEISLSSSKHKIHPAFPFPLDIGFELPVTFVQFLFGPLLVGFRADVVARLISCEETKVFASGHEHDFGNDRRLRFWFFVLQLLEETWSSAIVDSSEFVYLYISAGPHDGITK